MIIQLTSVDYSIGSHQLLKDVNFSVNDTNKIAIIGRNGCGKSTLFNILSGELSVDAGRRIVSSNARILLVKQELPDDDKTVLDYLKDQDKQLTDLYDQLDTADGSQVEALYDEITQLEDERYGVEATLVLIGLGIPATRHEQPMRELSGGIRMRIALASALLQKPDLLLLDEPTNHLDLPSVTWLTEYLKHYSRPFVLISHDRTLINEVVNKTYHLQNGKLTCYNGNFDTFDEQYHLIKEQARSTNINMDKKIAEQQRFIDAHKSDPKWAGICHTREGWIANLNEARPEIEYEAPPIPIQFPECSTLQDPIINAESCSALYGSQPILSNVTLSVQTKSRIGVLGKNGEGKSTLVRMLMQQMVSVTGGLNANPRLSIGYFSQEQSDIMQNNLTVFQQQKTMMEEKADEQILDHLLHFGFKRAQCSSLVGSLSGGEKTRLAFAMIAAKNPHLIIMDEPSNHLDFETRASLISAIKSFNGAIILVSHDWDLLEKTTNSYWLVKNGAVKTYTKGLHAYKEAILSRMDQPQKAGEKTKATAANKKSDAKGGVAAAGSMLLFPSNKVKKSNDNKTNAQSTEKARYKK